MERKAFLTFMAIAAFTAAAFLSPEANAQKPDDTFPGDFPEYPCGFEQTVDACSHIYTDPGWSCS